MLESLQRVFAYLSQRRARGQVRWAAGAQASRPAEAARAGEALAWSPWPAPELAGRGLLGGTERSCCRRLSRAGTQLLLSQGVVWVPLHSAARSCCEERSGVALPF